MPKDDGVRVFLRAEAKVLSHSSPLDTQGLLWDRAQAGSPDDKISHSSRSKLEGIGGGEAVASPSSSASSLPAEMVQPKRLVQQCWRTRLQCVSRSKAVCIWNAWCAN